MTSFNHETPSREELEKSKRWFKSATPKYTLDWYIKWVASIFLLTAMSMRGIEGLHIYDLSFSINILKGTYSTEFNLSFECFITGSPL